MRFQAESRAAALSRTPLEEQAQLEAFDPASTHCAPVVRCSPPNAPRREEPRKFSGCSTTLISTSQTKMSNPVKSKAAAAKRGCLSARHWQDLRQAARLARSEDITLIMHGVTVTPRGKENQPQVERNSLTTVRGGRGQPTEAVGKACEHSSQPQCEQRPPKKQRDQPRSLGRLHEFQRALACGARWLPLAQQLLRRERAISRARVWTERMEQKLALRDKMCAFLGRALRRASSLTSPAQLAVRDRPSSTSRSGAFARLGLRYIALRYQRQRDQHEAEGILLPEDLRRLFKDYRVAINFEAAEASLEPFDENRPPLAWLQADAPHPSRPPGEQRGAKGASKKPKGSRSRGRR